MTDLAMSWGGDLALSPTGDLAVIAEPSSGTERVLRRLLTNQRDYIWNPEYGAGLAQYVGSAIDTAVVESLIRLQMALEPAVASVPEPMVALTQGLAGEFFVQVRYEDSATAISSTVNASVVK